MPTHIHSPAGGRGMNTRIATRSTCPWKIAEVLHRRAIPSCWTPIRPSDFPSRGLLIATTDRVFKFLVDDGGLAQLVRVHIAPHVISTVAGSPHRAADLQDRVPRPGCHTAPCHFNQGGAGGIRGGDRLPRVTFRAGTTSLRCGRCHGTCVVYGEPGAAVVKAAMTLPSICGVSGFGERAESAGLQRDAAYLVQPDGYVALALRLDTRRS